MKQILRMGQTYRYQNPECRAEIEVTEDAREREPNPSCSCGSEMKKPYTPHVLSKLDKNAAVLLASFGGEDGRMSLPCALPDPIPRTTPMLGKLSLSLAILFLWIGVLLLSGLDSGSDASQTARLLSGATLVSLGLVTILLVAKDWLLCRRHYKNAVKRGRAGTMQQKSNAQII